MQAGAPALVLASASAARAGLLASAGLAFEAVAAGIDEDAVKRQGRDAGTSPEAVALQLAGLKAAAVDRSGAVVIGADQILVCEGAWFDKPPDLAAARAQLRALRGRIHTLATAAVAYRDGRALWRYSAAPLLQMRDFTDAFLDRYLHAEGDAVLGSVGAYRLEGLGQHLFRSVAGEHSAILGLPMLPLLAFLRSCGIVPA